MNPVYEYRWHQMAHRLMDDLLRSPGATLPGVRTLAPRYNVSRKTVERALAYFEELGILAPAEGGRKRQIHNARLRKVASSKGNMSANRILFVSVVFKEIQTSHLVKHIFENFRELCEKSGFFLSPFDAARASPSKLKTLLAELRPRGAIVHGSGNPALNAVLALDIPAIGVAMRDSRLPCFFHRNGYLDAWLHARAMGHSRVAMPVVMGAEAVYEEFASELKQLADRGGFAFNPVFNFPKVQTATVEEYHDLLDRLFRHTPPTCLVLDDLSHYLAASSFLQQRRLRTPSDVSIILLTQDPLLADILPSIAHNIRYDPNGLARAFATLREQMNGLRSHEQVVLSARWVPGDSLAPPPKP